MFQISASHWEICLQIITQYSSVLCNIAITATHCTVSKHEDKPNKNLLKNKKKPLHIPQAEHKWVFPNNEMHSYLTVSHSLAQLTFQSSDNTLYTIQSALNGNTCLLINSIVLSSRNGNEKGENDSVQIAHDVWDVFFSVTASPKP